MLDPVQPLEYETGLLASSCKCPIGVPSTKKKIPVMIMATLEEQSLECVLFDVILAVLFLKGKLRC